jgi:hypothetical protein
MARFRAIIEDARSPVVLTTNKILNLLKPAIASIPEFADLGLCCFIF